MEEGVIGEGWLLRKKVNELEIVIKKANKGHKMFWQQRRSLVVQKGVAG